MVGKKRKMLAAKAQATTARKHHGGLTHQERRAQKLERRRKEKKSYTANDWAAPAPSHLVAKLDLPKVKSKYQSYFEFADNPEKKEKKLEFTVVNDAKPPPGFIFVPIGDPILTNKCKELSREREAMIFIVSTWKEENSKISEHVHRTGYHFRESIVEEAREIIGERVITKSMTTPGFIEPIPESQDEINKQADAAIRDLFPRIPNIDRTMIIEQSFKKGAEFHGEPTVGLQSNIPLSRRVQLAVLAHIRHTHTRYDKLLRETSWMNARKAVEPVCLDVLVRWRGDEETGRDQMDEILREVVIITDSEGESDSSDEEDDSDSDDEITSASSAEPSLPASHNQPRPAVHNPQPTQAKVPSTSQGPHLEVNDTIPSRTRSKVDPNKKAQRGFKRYQAAWDEAIHRRQERPASGPNLASIPYEDSPMRHSQVAITSKPHGSSQYPAQHYVATQQNNSTYQHTREDDTHHAQPPNISRPAHYYSQQGPIQGPSSPRGEEVVVRPRTDRPVYYQEVSARFGTPSHVTREQRPPQVVRGSPLKRGPEDMPLPSIETTSSNITIPYKDDVQSHHENFILSQDFHPRRVGEPRLRTPAAGEVIVINDETPPVKRRRVIYEDDSRSFRPVPSRDHGPYVSASQSASYLIPASSAQSEHFLSRRPVVPSYSAPGLVRRDPEFYTDPVTAERLPVYDAPAPVYQAQRPEYARRMEVEPIIARRIEDRIEQPRHSQLPRDGMFVGSTQTPLNARNKVEGFQDMGRDQVRQVQSYNYGARTANPSSTDYPVSQQSRSVHGFPSDGPDRDLIHSFSQSRLDGPSSQARNGFTVISERSRPDHGNEPRYGEHPSRPTIPEIAQQAESQHERSIHHGKAFVRQPAYEYVPSQARYLHVDDHARLARDQYPHAARDVRMFHPTDQRQIVHILD